MDTNETTAKSASFGRELTKTFTNSLAASAGVWGGMVLVGLTVNALSKRKSASEPENTTEES